MSSSFPVDLTSVLSGASVGQLRYWRRKDRLLLVPEISANPALYSFRDLLALRTVVRLRRTHSLQAIRTAFSNLREFDLTEHPSQYHLVAHGKSIVLIQEGKEAMDLVKSPGSYLLATMDDIFAQFETRNGRRVVDFLAPRPHLAVRETRLGGWPTAENSRVAYDSIAALMATGEVSAADVPHYYPSVTPEAATDAASFAAEVAAVNKAA
ncbi:MAG TPA: DUF433 domain-containing protein [Nakamurella sp.]